MVYVLNADYCHPNEVQFGAIYPIDKLFEAVQELDSFNPFRVINLNLTDADLNNLKQFEITNIENDEKGYEVKSDFNSFYQIDDLDDLEKLYNNCIRFLKSISPESDSELFSSIAKLITNVAKKIDLSFPYEKFTLVSGLRASLPSQNSFA